MSVSVLVVDDDAGYRRVASELLDARGYRVVGQAATAREALMRTNELGPDAIVLDVRLPDGDGITIAGGLSARSDSPRILLVSSDPDAVSTDELRACGAAGFVAKARLAGADLSLYLSP
jgi:two-component system nitrate/nitrite response regulator NarL